MSWSLISTRWCKVPGSFGVPGLVVFRPSSPLIQATSRPWRGASFNPRVRWRCPARWCKRQVHHRFQLWSWFKSPTYPSFKKLSPGGGLLLKEKNLTCIYIYTLYIYSLDIFGSFSLFGLLVKACQTFSLGWTPQNYLQRLLVYEEFGSTWAVNNAMASWLARQWRDWVAKI